MKRVWIAISLLLVILVGTLCHSFYVDHLIEEITGLLEQAEDQAEQGEWAAAEESTQLASHRWQERDAYLHIMLHHKETDQIHTGFRQVAKWIQYRESGEYSAANASLITELELLNEGEHLNLKNIL
ncbi:MAG: DUF4363 family protein [Pseudoflavonifractor sp.]|nr:DUF4363 family protein [Pseudoflavonifractor sp.]